MTIEDLMTDRPMPCFEGLHKLPGNEPIQLPEVWELSQLEPPVPRARDELLQNRFLERGTGLLIVGPSGVGKSSFGMQAAIQWALGREAFGAKPNGPLKSLIIQAENPKGDLGEMKQGVVTGLSLSADDQATAGKMVLLAREDRYGGSTLGDAILKPLLERHRPDLLWLDPALAYIEGDAMTQKDTGFFLRRVLNPILRQFDCGGVVIHHTSKPSREKSSKENPLDFTYAGSGSAEWANWPRAVLFLQQKSHAEFKLHAAKRGARLGWKQADELTPLYHKFLRHSRQPGLIHWEEIDDVVESNPAKMLDTEIHEMMINHLAKPTLKDRFLMDFRELGVGATRARQLLNTLVGEGDIIQTPGHHKTLSLNPERFEIRSGVVFSKKVRETRAKPGASGADSLRPVPPKGCQPGGGSAPSEATHEH